MSSDNKLAVDLFTVCDYALTDKQGKLSILGMFNKIFTQALPAHYARFFAVAVLRGEAGEAYPVGLRVVAESGDEVMPERKVLVKMGESEKSNLVTDIQGLHLEQAGNYRVQLRLEDKVIGETELQVIQVSRPKADKGGLKH